MVLTSYNEVLASYPRYNPPKELGTFDERAEWWQQEYEEKLGALHRIKWYRVILDEAQSIKNYESQTSKACRALSAKYRWAISGTPILNTVDELYPYFKFLRVKHTGSYDVFVENFCKKGGAAHERLQAYLRQFMMRRTRQDTLFSRPMVELPEPHQVTYEIEFNEVERAIYDTVDKDYKKFINKYDKKGMIQKKYNNILAKLLHLRQLTAHPFICQEVIENVLTLADVERIWSITSSEITPDNPNRNMILQMHKIIESRGQTNPKLPASEEDESEIREDPNGPPAEEIEEEAMQDSNSNLVFRFQKYLRDLKLNNKWRDLRERSTCHKC